MAQRRGDARRVGKHRPRSGVVGQFAAALFVRVQHAEEERIIRIPVRQALGKTGADIEHAVAHRRKSFPIA